MPFQSLAAGGAATGSGDYAISSFAGGVFPRGRGPLCYRLAVSSQSDKVSDLLLASQGYNVLLDINEAIVQVSPVEKRCIRRGIHAGYVAVVAFGLRITGLLRMLYPCIFLETRLR